MEASKWDAPAPVSVAAPEAGAGDADPAVGDGDAGACAVAADPTPAEDDRAARLEVARRQGFLSLILALDRLVPGALDVGGEAAPEAELLRFRHDPSLTFSASEVVEVAERSAPAAGQTEARPRREITTTFLGVTGAVSPLPAYLPEEIAQEDPAEARNRAFLDLFHHRALSFLARALLEYDPAASHLSDASDPWSARLLAWLGVGLGAGGAQERAEALDEPAATAEREARLLVLRAAGILGERALTAEGLEAILNDAAREDLPAGARVVVEQFVGVWLPIPEGDRTRLGAQASALGGSFVLGSRVFDRSSKVAVVVGPVDREGYQRFVWGGAAARLGRAIAAATRGELTYDVVLELAPGAAPPVRLGSSRLGADGWLGRQREPARVRIGGGPVGGARAGG